MQQSQNLEEQLKTIKSEIDILKVGEKQSHLDDIHEQNVLQGTNKYSTHGRVCIHIIIFVFLILLAKHQCQKHM